MRRLDPVTLRPLASWTSQKALRLLAAAQGAVYVLDADQRITILGSDLQVLWRFDAGSQVPSIEERQRPALCEALAPTRCGDIAALWSRNEFRWVQFYKRTGQLVSQWEPPALGFEGATGPSTVPIGGNLQDMAINLFTGSLHILSENGTHGMLHTFVPQW